MPQPRRLLPILAPAAALGLLAVPLLAQMPAEAPGKPDRTLVKAGTYKLDPNHTLVAWHVDHLGFSDYFGLFGDITGTLVLDPKNPAAAKVDVTIPVSKVLTASKGLNEHLLRPAKTAGGKPDFFGPEPADARFVSTEVKPGRDGVSATITGRLTLNGVTRPVTIAAKFYGAGKSPMGGAETVGFSGKASIMRSQFGITTGIPMVGDKVDLEISAPFERIKLAQ